MERECGNSGGTKAGSACEKGGVVSLDKASLGIVGELEEGGMCMNCDFTRTEHEPRLRTHERS